MEWFLFCQISEVKLINSQVSHLETGHLASLREFRPAPDYPEHILTDAQVP